jgi:4-hydroxyphenylpyruvate dioxygenase
MKIDHIHFYVEDAAQTSDWLIQKMGFQSGGQQINEHTHTAIVGSGQILLRVSSALSDASPVAKYLDRHPAGVVDIAFLVEDLDVLRARIDQLNIQVITDRTLSNHDSSQITIKGWGDYQHTLIADHAKKSAFTTSSEKSLIDIDHVVLNVAQHQLVAATQWYQDIFDFQVQQSFEIQTNYSGLYSKALIDPTGQVQFNINEPSTANSQIQTFLNLHRGAGIQHVALKAQNIFQAVASMRTKNLEFLSIPDAYYQNLKNRLSYEDATEIQQINNFPLSQKEWQELGKSGVLLDWSDSKNTELLLQIFTQPIFAQPTFFFEIIERRGQAQGFGEGNFLALFQAIEKESKCL